LSGGIAVYAIVRSGGHQYRVSPGEIIEVERFDAEPGSQVTLDEVLLVSGDSGVQVGNPTVGGAKVLATVLRQTRGKKIIVFKFKAKKRYRRKTGHRQNLTRLSINEISIPEAKGKK
jgi:large subunit ribosomal protein L21